MPKVSVIIPTYNRAWCLRNAIESVLAQTFQDLELLVIDDGSTDETAQLVASLDNVGYYRQENRGVSAARNIGFALTHGEYLVFLDSDDFLTQDALQLCVGILDKHPEVGFCYGQFYLLDEGGRPTSLRGSSLFNSSRVINGTEQIKELLFTDRIRLSATMVRRSLLEEVGLFDENMKHIGEDFHLFVRMAKKSDVAYISQPLVKMQRHSGCLSLNHNGRSAERAYLAILQEIFEDPVLANQFRYLSKIAHFNFYSRIAFYAYGNDMMLSRHYAIMAISVYRRSLLGTKGAGLLYLCVKSIIPARVRRLTRDIRSRLWRRSVKQRDIRAGAKAISVNNSGVEG